MSRFKRWALLAVAAGLALALWAFAAGQASAHANLLRSSPAAGEVVDEPPQRVVLWFSEPLVPSLSGIELLDQAGQRVATDKVYVSPTETTALVAELSGVPRGAYTVAWRNTSTVDGHSVRGSFTFFYGVPATPVDAPESQVPLLQNGADPWARWVVFAGMAVLAGGLLFEMIVAVPVLTGQEAPAMRAAAWRASQITVVALAAAAGVALVASAGQLLLQARAAGGSSILSGAATALTDTRWGQMWALRTGLLAAAGLALVMAAKGRRKPADAGGSTDDETDSVTFATESVFGPAALLLATGALAVTSFMGHSAAAPADIRTPAIVTDLLHILSTGAWVGGLAYLAINLPVFLQRREGPDGRAALAAMVDRFSLVAMLAGGTLVITGLFSGWIHVTRPGAVASPYGWALVAKLAAVAVLITAAAVNSYVLRPRLRNDARAGGNMRRLVVVEVVAAAVVLLGAGWLSSLEPARSYAARLEAERGQAGREFEEDVESGRIEVVVEPAGVGANKVSVGVFDRRGQPVTSATDVRVRLVYREQDLGAAFVSAADSGGGLWVADGLAMNVAGDWQVEVVVVRPDAFDARAAFGFTVGADTLAAEAGRPTRNATVVLFGVEVALLGLLAVAAVAPKWRSERRLAVAVGVPGAAAVVAGALVAALTYAGSSGAAAASVNPVLPTEESVSRGRAAYAQTCAACHGASGTGDGPEAHRLPKRPADLTVHVPLHPDSVLYGFIRDGIPASGMPPFRDQLREDEVWDLVNYLRELAEGR
jgi:copper transport protein